MSNGTSAEQQPTRGRPERISLSRASRPARRGSPHGMGVLSAGVPVILLHGVGGGGGFLDEIITFGLLGGLVVGLVLLSLRGARNKKKTRNPGRSRRDRRRRR